MTRRLFCRAGQRAMFGNRLIMRRKPVDNSISHGLFGSHEGAPAKRNDVVAELVATVGPAGNEVSKATGRAMAPEPLVNHRDRGHFDSTFWISISIKRGCRGGRSRINHPAMILTLAHIFLCSDWNLGTCISLE